MSSKREYLRIGAISNYYGGIYVFEEDNKFYWTIEDWYGFTEENQQEIPETLYRELINFDKLEENE